MGVLRIAAGGEATDRFAASGKNDGITSSVPW
jgi:hypothetical protein